MIEFQIDILLTFIVRNLDSFSADVNKIDVNEAQAIPNSLCFAKIVFANTSRAR